MVDDPEPGWFADVGKAGMAARKTLRDGAM
jgi:hypothetical protein